MGDSSEKHLWVSWDEYNDAIVGLARLIHESGWKFDQVLCLARGGLRPGDIFSRIFDVPLAILSTSSYREEAGTVQGNLDIAKHITISKGTLGGKVLLLDDLVDSGVTISAVQRHLNENFSAISEVRSAVIWCKACSAIKPNYYLHHLPHNPWIHQPMEEYDSLRPHQLAAWLRKGEDVRT
jgi:uncharacterized protein